MAKLTLRQLAWRCIKAVDPSYKILWWKQHARTGRMKTWTWDGTGTLRCSEPTDVGAMHDIAHVMVASPSRRKMPEFGLGGDPANSARLGEPPMAMAASQAQDEEVEACALHWALVAYCEGGDGANFVEGYLSMDIPSHQKIVGMKKYGGLPEDFVSEVLKVRRECMGDR